MDKDKLLKSKSSNDAYKKNKRTKERNEKKTRSNAAFQPSTLKKRGVYVEKRSSKLAPTGSPERPPTAKAPPRCKPGSKNFLASVLTILSKSTAGTQYPSICEDAEPTNQPEEAQTMNEPEIEKANAQKDDAKPEQATKKQKYKSRVLNEEIIYKSLENVIVLKSNRDKFRSPSNNSVRFADDAGVSIDSLNWSEFLPRLVNDDGVEQSTVKQNILQNIQDIDHGVAKEVLEGRRYIENKNHEPSTLPDKDNKLYSFFVDLLETVYNVQPDDNTAGKSHGSSNANLEIDEAVAQKLSFKKETDPNYQEDSTIKPTHLQSIRNNDSDWDDQELVDYFKTPLSSKWSDPAVPPRPSGKKKRLRSKSFAFTNKRKGAMAKSFSSVMEERNTSHRKTKKVDLLNILKEELEMEVDSVEQPQNLYQALREIARNKKKYERSLQFHDATRKKSKPDDDYSECVFKRRKVFSSSTRSSNNKYYKPESKLLRNSSVKRKYSANSIYSRSGAAESTIYDEPESYHSLEVIGFDYQKKASVISLDYTESDYSGDRRLASYNQAFTAVSQDWID